MGLTFQKYLGIIVIYTSWGTRRCTGKQSKTLQPHSTQAFHVLVAISECDSLCRPRHSICLQLLIKPITYVHPGIPSYPSEISPPLAPSSPPPSPHLFPLSPLPVAPLSISSSPCPPPHCQPLPIPIAPLSIAPFQIPPPCLHPPRCHPPLPIPPPSCPPSPPPTSHSLPAFGHCQPLSILFPIAPPPTGS